MISDTPGYGRELLAALRQWLTDDEVCGSLIQGDRPCLRISACQSPLCDLRDKSPDPK